MNYDSKFFCYVLFFRNYLIIKKSYREKINKVITYYAMFLQTTLIPNHSHISGYLLWMAFCAYPILFAKHTCAYISSNPRMDKDKMNPPFLGRSAWVSYKRNTFIWKSRKCLCVNEENCSRLAYTVLCVLFAKRKEELCLVRCNFRRLLF